VETPDAQRSAVRFLDQAIAARAHPLRRRASRRDSASSPTPLAACSGRPAPLSDPGVEEAAVTGCALGCQLKQILNPGAFGEIGNEWSIELASVANRVDPVPDHRAVHAKDVSVCVVNTVAPGVAPDVVWNLERLSRAGLVCFDPSHFLHA
jgi:hypothetical protein